MFYKPNRDFAKPSLCHLFSLYDNPGDSYLWRNDYNSHSSKYSDRGHHFFYYACNRLHHLPWFRGSRKSSRNIYSLYCAIFNLILIFLLTSGEIQLHNIEPILGDGIKPILKAMFPSLFVFPFGELVVFTIILTSVTQLKKSKKVAFIAVLSRWYFPCCHFYINGHHIRSGCFSIYKFSDVKYDKIDINWRIF